MVDTDWREILSFSQRELGQAEKEKLCEDLSWMEADDIELNFSDLKTLFRLAQDILKYKSEQVNSLLGQLETAQRKTGKRKSKRTYEDSPSRSTDDVLETIAHQEEVIKANKEILEQLYADIAELEGRKSRLEEDRNNYDKDSESSRDALSEINAMAELENELTMKNRHIRKLLCDVKVLEEQNTKLKDKVSVLNEKLTEATGLIENLTEQLFSINSENNRLKEVLGKSEKDKASLSIEIEALRKELFEKESTRDNIYEEIKSKVQHWKNLAKSKKAENEVLANENEQLKENLLKASQSQASSPKVKENQAQELKIKELQEKLAEATDEILKSANIIDILKAENKQLKVNLEETLDFSITDAKNESDEGKERAIINKLKKKVKTLTIDLQATEEMVALREKELTEITSQLQLLKSDEGINALLEGLKNKKRKLKLKDEGIKSLVQEVNTLSQLVDDLQLQNEMMRQQLNISLDEKVPTKGILKKYRDMEHNSKQLTKDLRNLENKLISAELDNRNLHIKLNKLVKKLDLMGVNKEKIDEICQTTDSEDDIMPADGGGEGSTMEAKRNRRGSKDDQVNIKIEQEMQALTEENEGLRKGLQEILEFLKDNSKTTSGVLAVECRSLETVLHSMEARHAAGWFAPHMTTVMELKAALGGKDALMTALHEARKETFEVMNKLSKETEKSRGLEKKLNDAESKIQAETEKSINKESATDTSIGEFGTWMTDTEQSVSDFSDKSQIEDIINKGNLIYESQLKNGLKYFHKKFKTLFEKMTSLSVQTADDQNKWSIQEERYKAEIENLKALASQNEEDDLSDTSPGIVHFPDVGYLQRKCSYLEEAYKYIRTLNENMKNEYLEAKRDAMIVAADYENENQKLILALANLTDRLRSSISIDLFWKQNQALNEINIKYRKLIEVDVRQKTEMTDLFHRLEIDKLEVINNFQKVLMQNEEKEENYLKSITSSIEKSIFSKQLEQVCSELEQKNKKIVTLETNILELQEAQSKLIDETLSSSTKKDVNLIKDQLEKLADENKILKEQCQHIGSQLDIALLQLQDTQQRQMCYDLEVNMLRHQILDLQSVGDNKAIVARLSGEVLVAHLQASESHKKIERLNVSLNKEKQLRVEAEEMLRTRQKIFEVYTFRYEAKFRYMYEIMQVLRQQYQGSLPIISLENYLNKDEELSRKTHEVDKKLDEIEDLHVNLMAKHSIFDQILDVSKNKCYEDEDSCPHRLKNIVLQGTYSREFDHYKTKIKVLEQSRDELLKRCNHLEKTLVLTNQGFEKTLSNIVDKKSSPEKKEDDSKLEMEDVQSDSETESRRSKTITLPKPQVLKPPKSNIDLSKNQNYDNVENLVGSPIKTPDEPHPKAVNVFVQTSTSEPQRTYKIIQTEEDREYVELRNYAQELEIEIERKNKELNEVMVVSHDKSEKIEMVTAERNQLNAKIQTYKESAHQKDRTIDAFKSQMDDYKKMCDAERFRNSGAVSEDNKALINALKQFEQDKNEIVTEFKELFEKEREEYAKSVKSLQVKIVELQTQLDRKPSETNAANADALKETISKYTVKIADLEDRSFKLQTELDTCKSELTTYHSELERWKDLANERLAKMEHLNSQLEERHCHEVESYKAENEHWMSQLNESQKEQNELRSRISEQKAGYIKQLSEKDAQIEHLRSVVRGLKTQILNMQTMISVADPSFDLTAIVEVEEGIDNLSAHGSGSERLELKYDSMVEIRDSHDDFRISTSSTSVWQEPVIERLRREKQLTNKQNTILRRQIKALAARERRARLDAQNLKNQVFRISTTGSKVVTAETAALHNKITTLQAQLMSARKDSHSTVALWDKWKRAQQAAERWQSRFEEKCQEVKKLEAGIALAKSSVSRLEKEKRVLLARLTEVKSEKVLVVEKQDSERSEKLVSERLLEDERRERLERDERDPPVSARALLERVQAQQRRIEALQASEKGNEHLVSEYEKALAEITSLKGQVLKLESALLEAQIKVPLENSQHDQSELEYWKNYCEMLKEENVQLNLKVSSLEPHITTGSTSTHHHRINDLEQTVLTLRGLVSKLQSEQKSSGVLKRSDSRPSTDRSAPDKYRTQLESYRTEISNLRRSIQDKDQLLERSKEMLKIAAEREDDLLRENTSLRRQLNELRHTKGGFLSA